MSRLRLILCIVLALISVEALPARAQVMTVPGFDIPWFRSASEQAQRDACRRNLPECRAAVRAQMEFEQSITVWIPWFGLGLAVLAVLSWLRKQEKARERKKRLARDHHTPGAHRKMDKAKTEKAFDDEESDRLAL